MKRTILLGKGELAVRAAQWLHDDPAHDLIAVVPVVPEPSWTTSLTSWCDTNGVAVVASGHHRDVARVVDGPIDLAVSVFYDKIIPASFIEQCDRIVNLHNGPLPRYRGVSPINWALKNGEATHGATIHELTPGIDDGAVIAQVCYSIHPEIDEVIDVYERAIEYGWVLFRTTLPMLDDIDPTPQDETIATYYSRREDPLLGDRRGFTRATSPVTVPATR